MSDKTKKVLEEKGFETMTPIQSQSYDLVYSGVDVVGTNTDLKNHWILPTCATYLHSHSEIQDRNWKDLRVWAAANRKNLGHE